MKQYILSGFLAIFFVSLHAQQSFVLSQSIAWSQEADTIAVLGEPCLKLYFPGGLYSDEHPDIPLFTHRFTIPGNGSIRVEVINLQFERLEKNGCPGLQLPDANLSFETAVLEDRSQFVGSVSFLPVISNGSSLERLVSFSIGITFIPDGGVQFRDPTQTNRSVLADGVIYKIAVNADGVHKINQAFLRSLGINTDQLDPKKISIYGNGGGMLPFLPSAARPDDLLENHIFVAGEEDGRFDANDYILFYAEGPDKWVFNPTQGKFFLEKNVFDDKNYYFLKIGSQNGARISQEPSLNNAATTIITFDDYARFEEDRRNLLHEWEGKATGSGLQWYGERFKNQRQKLYNNLFSFPNLITAVPVKLDAEMVLRSGRSSRFEISTEGQIVQSTAVSSVIMSGPNDNITDYARVSRLSSNINAAGNNINLTLAYPYPTPGNTPDDSEGWLDWIQVNVKRSLTLSGSQMAFRSIESISVPSANFRLSGVSSAIRVWDITNPVNPRDQQIQFSGNQLDFSVNTGVLKQFIAFDPSANLPTPQAVGILGNQNYHGLDEVDMVVLYHPDFVQAASTLARHRRDYSGLQVAMVRIDSLYNEFSSGRQDPTAIRDFMKMLYEKNNRLKYLLLFGDASFDYKNIYSLGGNFVPTFQRDGLNPLNSHPSDDYFGLLSNASSSNPLAGMMQIAVGRLTVNTPDQAEAVVRKIIHYDTQEATLGDWRNRMVFVADDEDGNTHIRDADAVSLQVASRLPTLNIDRIYLDAYRQQSTPGGNFYPEVNEAISRAMFKGILALTYFGHGGPKALAQERILTISDILSWRNLDNMPLLITATCTFGAYDDPVFVSAGEEAFLNPNGGAIALYSTTRAVFANYNKDLSQEALIQLVDRSDGQYPSIGEALRRAKNALASNSGLVSNSRKFTLIGDPALSLKIPVNQVVTTSINSNPVVSGTLDTIRALQRVTIEGEIQNSQGQLISGFNGFLTPSLFDKPLNIVTLGQDAGSFPFPFSVQRSVLFRGRATIQGGKFRFSFVVPKDIDYRFGNGKASFYAYDSGTQVDAAGQYSDIIVGGTDNSVISDNQGPDVRVFLNSEDFIFGGYTNDSPVLIVRLEDESGINVVGNSIGHDLEAVVDENTQNTLVLNDFYESDLDDYTRGIVRYPLFKLSDGLHKVQVKAWDVANNSGMGYTEFVVASSEKIAIERVLNYPNPFTDFTCFQFDHSAAGANLDVIIHIYTVSGRLVKTIQTTMLSDGALRLDDCIAWDGTDDFGEKLARGVYVYMVKLQSLQPGLGTVSGESSFEKLVILK